MPKPSRKKCNALFFDKKSQKFKNAVCWYFCQAHFMLFVLKPKENLLTRKKGNNSDNHPMGQSKFSYELTFWYISIKNGGKQKK